MEGTTTAPIPISTSTSLPTPAPTPVQEGDTTGPAQGGNNANFPQPITLSSTAPPQGNNGNSNSNSATSSQEGGYYAPGQYYQSGDPNSCYTPYGKIATTNPFAHYASSSASPPYGSYGATASTNPYASYGNSGMSSSYGSYGTTVSTNPYASYGNSGMSSSYGSYGATPTSNYNVYGTSPPGSYMQYHMMEPPKGYYYVDEDNDMYYYYSNGSFFCFNNRTKQYYQCNRPYEAKFDHAGWHKKLRAAAKRHKNDDIRKLRLEVLNDTFNRLENGWYKSCTGQNVAFEKGVHDTANNIHNVIKYDFTTRAFTNPPPLEERPFKKTEVVVCDTDCVVEALNMLAAGMKPAVINMADASTPGGGYLQGAGAQEENLFRRSNCHEFLDPNKSGFNPDLYPIPLIGGHYVPGVTIFRGPESEGYPLLPEPKKIDVLTVAALPYPNVYYDEDKEAYLMREEDAETMFKKIRVLFEMAIEKKNDGIVLSAIGCGAFRNPPNHIAELFLEATKIYYGYFKKIVYAIFEDHNSKKDFNPDGNYIPFKTVFEGFNEKYPPKDSV